MHRARTQGGRCSLPFCGVFARRPSPASPQAHILRIDPLAGISNGAPELTTLVELVEQKQMSDVLLPCNSFSGDAALECQSTQLEKPGALWSALKFPDANAQLTVQVDGAASPGEVRQRDAVGRGEEDQDPRMGTAWLIALDASSGMGSRYQEAYRITYEFLQAMEPNDQVDLMIFDDRATIADSKWKTFAQRNDLVTLLNSHQSPAPSHGRDRALFTQIKTMVNDGFGSLGNTGGPADHPAAPGDGRAVRRLRSRRRRERLAVRRRVPPVPRRWPVPRRQHLAAEDAAAGHLAVVPRRQRA